MAMRATLTDKEIIALEAKTSRHRRNGAAAWVKSLGIPFIGAALVTAVGAEYGIWLEIFEQVKGPLLPGQTGQYSVPLLALTGTMAMTATHLSVHFKPKGVVARFIERATHLAIPLYVVGAFAAFSSVIFFGGADTLTHAADTAADLLSTPQITADQPTVMDRLMRFLPGAFSLGCGAMVVINMYVAHRLLSILTESIRDVATRLRAASEAKRAMKIIREGLRRYAELAEEREALLAVTDEDLRLEAADVVLSTVNKALSGHESFLRDEAIRRGAPECRFLEGRTNLDADQVARHVAAIRKETMRKNVLAAMRSKE